MAGYAFVEIDLILKGIKTHERGEADDTFPHIVEIDLILKGIKTRRRRRPGASGPPGGNRPDSQRD